jgi:hypothetical protein
MNICWRQRYENDPVEMCMPYTDQIISTYFRARLGVEAIVEVCRLIKFGHVERRGDTLGEVVYTDAGGRQLAPT